MQCAWLWSRRSCRHNFMFNSESLSTHVLAGQHGQGGKEIPRSWTSARSRCGMRSDQRRYFRNCWAWWVVMERKMKEFKRLLNLYFINQRALIPNLMIIWFYHFIIRWFFYFYLMNNLWTRINQWSDFILLY